MQSLVGEADIYFWSHNATTLFKSRPTLLQLAQLLRKIRGSPNVGGLKFRKSRSGSTGCVTSKYPTLCHLFRDFSGFYTENSENDFWGLFDRVSVIFNGDGDLTKLKKGQDRLSKLIYAS